MYVPTHARRVAGSQHAHPAEWLTLPYPRCDAAPGSHTGPDNRTLMRCTSTPDPCSPRCCTTARCFQNTQQHAWPGALPFPVNAAAAHPGRLSRRHTSWVRQGRLKRRPHASAAAASTSHRHSDSHECCRRPPRLTDLTCAERSGRSAAAHMQVEVTPGNIRHRHLRGPPGQLACAGARRLSRQSAAHLPRHATHWLPYYTPHYSRQYIASGPSRRCLGMMQAHIICILVKSVWHN